jgi:ParB/RepB/Spo0J family partition protein
MSDEKDTKETSIPESKADAEVAKFADAVNAEEDNKNKNPVTKKKTTAKKKIPAKKKIQIKKKTTVKKKDDAVIGNSRIFVVDPKKIKIKSGLNRREDYGDMEDLKRKIIIAGGVKKPIHVERDTNGNLFVTDGHRRVQAVNELNKQKGNNFTLKAILDKKAAGLEHCVNQLINNDGKPFTPIEEAHIFQEFIDDGKDEKYIAEQTGRNIGTVKNRLILLQGSKSIQESIQQGKIPNRIGISIIKAHPKDLKKQNALLKTALGVYADKGNRKEKTKIRNEVLDEVGKSEGKKISPKRARVLLKELSSLYISFLRSKKPANSFNIEFNDLLKALNKVKKLSRKKAF